ncbi:Dcn1 [Kluyveromyces lactis]|nr:Dcn1 [Kluyveromyces lactis]
MEKEFMNLTGCTYSVAQEYLRKNGGRVEYALNDYYDNVDTIGGMRQSYNPSLVAIFEKYSNGVSSTEWDSSGLIRYIEDLGISIEDPITLCLSQMLCIDDLTKPVSREQFLDAWSDLCCDTLRKMKAYLHTLEERLETDKDYFKSIYSYTFPLNTEEGSRHLPKDVAIEYWNIFFKDNQYALKISKDRLNSWLEFINSDDSDPRKQNISNDIWLMFYKFIEQYPNDESLKKNYDEMAAWPLLIDEYYEFLEENDKL